MLCCEGGGGAGGFVLSGYAHASTRGALIPEKMEDLWPKRAQYSSLKMFIR
jgi:hypothetical protein